MLIDVNHRARNGQHAKAVSGHRKEKPTDSPSHLPDRPLLVVGLFLTSLSHTSRLPQHNKLTSDPQTPPPPPPLLPHGYPLPGIPRVRHGDTRAQS